MRMQTELVRRVEDYVRANADRMVSALCRLVAVESISAEPTGTLDAPYGPGCREALRAAQRLCEEMGLAFVNHENRCASVRMGGAAEEIGIFSHLDVVPPGTGWKSDPFAAAVEDGFVRGRGAIDNKAGAVVGLFALDCIRALDIPMRRALRLYFGCSEEDMMTDIDYYGKTVGWPAFSLVPDSVFPAAFAEKGIFAGRLTSSNPAEKILSLEAGIASNVVAADCALTLPADCFDALAPFASDRVSVRLCGGVTKLTAMGLSAHASRPEDSVNAIRLAFCALLSADVLDGAERGVVDFWHRALSDYLGKTLGIDRDAGEFGVLTIIGSRASLDEQRRFVFGFNARYPADDSHRRIAPIMERACAQAGLSLTVEEGVDGFSLSRDHRVVQAVTDVFNRMTGESRAPFLMKGATYCRVIPNAIPFGPQFSVDRPGFAPGHGGVHQPDEAMPISELLDAVRIYVAALYEIDGML